MKAPMIIGVPLWRERFEMSYESMAREAVCCDFPGCNKDFDDRRGRRIALVKDDEIMAFCAKHCKVLEAKGVRLRVLKEIHDEMTEAEEGPIRRQMEADRIAREKKFIEDLKK